MSGGYDGNDIAAAIGRIQLKKLPEFTRRRNEIRDHFNEAFGYSWKGNHLYPYFVDNQEEVGKFIEFMKSKGIGCGYHYPGNNWLGVSLPIYPDLTDEEVEYVIKVVKEYDKENRL
jgi:dTDP-4-amino-4,6-dideoxygalactose transaminase